jgi:hypothetical protein
MKPICKQQLTTERYDFYPQGNYIYTHYFRNLHAPITRQSIGLVQLKGTYKQLELEQLLVHAMGASFHNQWLTFKKGKGLTLIFWKGFCSS